MNRKQRICIISWELVGPHKNGGIGTHCYYLSAFLSRNLEQEVTFLYTGRIECENEAHWKAWFHRNLGVEFVWLPPPAESDPSVPTGLWGYFATIARQTYEWLRDRRFDVCHFQDQAGNGFRCFQAKRLGLAFQETLLTCTVHSPWEWICHAMQSFPQTGTEELQTKFMERYCIEHCDLLVSPSQHMLDWLDENRVKTSAKRHILPYLFDPGLKPAGYRKPDQHLIFFGRLEVRKGLVLLLETLLGLDRARAFGGRQLKVTFLGRPGYTPDGTGLETIRKYREQFSAGIVVAEQTELGQPEALEFLVKHNDALVVCPSLIDNSPYAVIESLQLGLNLIAAKSGGIPELFAGEERLFEPEPKALAAKILAGLNNELPPPAKRYDVHSANRLWRDACREMQPVSLTPELRTGSAMTRTVRVFLGLGQTQSATMRGLQALDAQTFKDFSVTVLAGGRSRMADRVGDEVRQYCRERKWELVEEVTGQSWRTERRAPALREHETAAAQSWSSALRSPPAVADPLLKDAPALPAPSPASDGSEYAVFLSAGCFPRPELLAQLVRSLNSSGLDALTCCAQVANEQAPRNGFVYEPLGPCLEGAFFNNLLGAGCVILKRNGAPENLPGVQKLLGAGGVWGCLAELSLKDRGWDVVPEVLADLQDAGDAFGYTTLQYPRHKEMVAVCNHELPAWLRHVLVNAMASERKLLAVQYEILQKDREIREALARQKLAPFALKSPIEVPVNGKVFFKIKRETRRIIKQCRDFPRTLSRHLLKQP